MKEKRPRQWTWDYTTAPSARRCPKCGRSGVVTRRGVNAEYRHLVSGTYVNSPLGEMKFIEKVDACSMIDAELVREMNAKFKADKKQVIWVNGLRYKYGEQFRILLSKIARQEAEVKSLRAEPATHVTE